MDHSDKRAFAEAMSTVFLHYNQEITSKQLETFWNALHKYEFDIIRGALNAHIHHPDDGRFIPKIANILRAIDGGIEEKASYAWTLVEEGIRRAGSYNDVVFEDPLIHIILDRLGGWVEICNIQTDKDLMFKGVEFVKNYRSMYGSQLSMAEPPVLLGVFSVMKNNGLKAKTQPPVLIGTDLNKIEKVLLSLTHKKPKLVQKAQAAALLERVKDKTAALMIGSADKSTDEEEGWEGELKAIGVKKKEGGGLV